MNYQRAEQLFKKAIAIDPSNADSYNNLGLVRQELKALDSALESYGKAIALQPDFAVAHYNRGLVLHELRKLDLALESYDKAIALKPDCEILYAPIRAPKILL